MFRTDEPYGHKWLYSFKVINEHSLARILTVTAKNNNEDLSTRYVKGWVFEGCTFSVKNGI